MSAGVNVQYIPVRWVSGHDNGVMIVTARSGSSHHCCKHEEVQGEGKGKGQVCAHERVITAA